MRILWLKGEDGTKHEHKYGDDHKDNIKLKARVVVEIMTNS